MTIDELMQTNAYIVWSLVTAGQRGLDAEIDAMVAAVPQYSKDMYYVGLVAGTLYQVCVRVHVVMVAVLPSRLCVSSTSSSTHPLNARASIDGVVVRVV